MSELHGESIVFDGLIVANRDLGLGWALTDEEVNCAGEVHCHCASEVTPTR